LAAVSLSLRAVPSRKHPSREYPGRENRVRLCPQHRTAGALAQQKHHITATRCASIVVVINYCKASRSRDSGTCTAAEHVPARRSRTPRTAAIDLGAEL
jgi:hypothetical protein